MPAFLPFHHVVEAIEAIAQRHPDKVALLYNDEILSYSELNCLADDLALQLRKQGIGSGIGVAICMERCPSLFVGILGILKSGAAYIPLDPSYPEQRIQFVLRDTGAPLLTLAPTKTGQPKQFVLTPPVADAQRLDIGTTAYIIYTSGSTGQPKGVIISHENLAHAAQDWLSYFAKPAERFMLLSSVMFDSSVIGIFFTWLSGGTLVLPMQDDEKEPEKIRQLFARHSVTHTLCLPSLYSLLLENNGAKAMQSLKKIIVAGEVCPPSLAVKHYDTLPNCQLYNGYGPTEATVHATTYLIPPNQSGNLVPIGKPLKGTFIYLLNENKQLVAGGDIGEIYIGGKGIAQGYLNRPELTAEHFLPNPFAAGNLYKTGDLARFLPDGNLEFIGRNDRQIKLRGYRIELDEIENVLLQLPNVREAAVICTDSNNGAKHIIAYLVLRNHENVSPASDYFAPKTPTAIYSELLSQQLPSYMIPSQFVLLDKLPLSPAGKIDRQALSKRFTLTTKQPPTKDLPRNSLEQYIADMWCDILQVSHIGIHDKFFELGGTSISAAQFAARLQHILQETVFIVTLFDNPTVAQYAQFLVREYGLSAINAALSTNKQPLSLVGEQEKETAKTVSPETSEQAVNHSEPIVDDQSIVEVLPPIGESKLQPFLLYKPIPEYPITDELGGKPLDSAVFILAPPRSGTSLLRLMLAGHPQLFAANELQLLHFGTLKERRAAYDGKFSLWLDGTISLLMEIEQCDANTAQAIMRQYEDSGMSVAQFYSYIQKHIGNKILVDKSPSYALHPAALQHAETLFDKAIYLHLVRHPYAMIRSFERQRMSQVMYLKQHPFSPCELGEWIWQDSHRNIKAFLQHIPNTRQFTVCYETLVHQPEVVMRALCQQVGLPYHENLLRPYDNLQHKGTKASREFANAMSDPKLLQQADINPALADVWQAVKEDNFLSDETWRIYHEDLGITQPDISAGAITDVSTEAMNHISMDISTDAINEVSPTSMTEPIPTKSKNAPIAIIGVAGRFPAADDVAQFWHNIFHAIDGGHEVTMTDLINADLPLDLLDDPNYVKRSYSLNDPKGFDADFFGYLPKEAEMMDPQHRVLLECAYSALENAGYTTDNYTGTISIFGGIARNAYLTANIATHPDLLAHIGDYAMSLGSEKDFAITRIAYKLNLKGAAINVQTACSTSGTALYIATQSLLAGDCDMALVCGGRIEVPGRVGYHYTEGGPLSPDGYCRAFDANAKGMVRGSGMLCIVLKRADQALADADTIYATINGIGISNDGTDKVGFTAPSVKGQVAAIVQAHKKAGIGANDVSYVETHGTGTLLGDPIEIAALTAAFQQTATKPDKLSCAIGSVKTNIGHLDAGACLAGVLKTALSLKYHLLPPSLHFEQHNPQIPFNKTPFYVQAKLEHWQRRNEKPLIAGVNSLGLGGTNVHIIMQEPPETISPPKTRRHRLILLSAKTQSALAKATENLANYLQNHPEISLADAAYTLQVGRQHHRAHRSFAVGSELLSINSQQHITDNDNPALLHREATHQKGQTKSIHQQLTDNNRQATANSHINVAFMFAGGGAQYSHMAADLYADEPVFRAAIDQCADILSRQLQLGIDIRDLIYPTDKNTIYDLEKPSFALTCLFTVEYALVQLWQSWGITPTAMIGHSAGEYAAAQVAGVLSLEDALALVLMRGRLFELLPEGGMLNVQLSPEQLNRYNLGIHYSIAAVNQTEQCVVSGSSEALATLAQALATHGIEAKRVHISVAAHSHLVEAILAQFDDFLHTITFHAPKIPFISNLTGTWIKPQEAQSPDYWVQHLRQTVRFADGLAVLLHEPNTVLLEVSPGQTLATYARRHPKHNPQLPILASMRHPKETFADTAFIYKTLGQLWQIGYPISWNSFCAVEPLQRVPLPTYPFEHKTYRIAPLPTIYSIAPKIPDIKPTIITQEAQPTHSNIANDMDTSRCPLIAAELQHLFHELSGMPTDLMDTKATFLELGFDSLFMTQAVASINKKMDVKIQFRQLFEEATTIAELAELLDTLIPPALFAENKQTNGLPTTEPKDSKNNGSNDSYTAEIADEKEAVIVSKNEIQPEVYRQRLLPNVGLAALNPELLTPIERIIAQQLDLMQQQLALLGNGTVKDNLTDEKKNELIRNAQTIYRKTANTNESPQKDSEKVAPSPNNPTVENGVVAQNGKDDDYVRTILEKTIAQIGANNTQTISGHAHGPWKPVDKKQAGITEHQQQHLQDLIARYATRTKGSKNLANTQRHHLADARSITGFNKLWKEMTYQIAVERSAGSKIWDLDDNEYIDFVMGFGINLFGHNPQFAQDAIIAQLAKGVHLGVLTPLAKEVAELICAITGMERAMFVNTGSEGVSAAVRAARTATGKSHVAVFEGDYHGIADELLVKGIKIGGKTLSRPVSPGIPQFLVENMIVLDYNDPNLLDIIREHADDLAAIVIEPLTAQNPHIQRFELLRQLRQVCTDGDIALIFDELITGFRLHPRGGQGWFGVEADICSYGKIICGGLPMAAVAGKSRFLDVFDGGAWQFGDDSFPAVGVTFFGGTFVRHPLCLATAKAALLQIQQGGIELYNDLNTRTARFTEQIRALFAKYQAPLAVYSTASIISFKVTDKQLLTRLFFFLMREKGVHVTERGGFTSTAHTEQDLERVLHTIELCLLEMRNCHFFKQSNEGKDNNDLSNYGIIVQSPYHNEKKIPLVNDFDDAIKVKIQRENPTHKKSNAEVLIINNNVPATMQQNGLSNIPLTEPQQEVWLGNEMEAHSAAGYNLSSAFRFEGILHTDKLRQSIDCLIARHDALRTSFSSDGTYQIVAKSIHIDLPLIDLSHLRSDEEVPYETIGSDVGAEQWALNTLQAAELKRLQSDTVATLFDLHHSPLLRVQLIRLDTACHILLMTVHHIVADGWSVGVLVSELSKIYTALAKNEPIALPIPKQFSEYALEKYTAKNSTEVIDSEKYWLEKLAGELPVLELPTDRPRPPVKTYAAAFEKVLVSAQTFAQLKQTAAKNGTTIFAFTLAAFKAFLYRISGQNEFVVGVIAAGQSTSDNQNLVGHCVSLLPVRAHIQEHEPFAVLLKKTRSEVLDLFQYHHCTFNTLLKKLKYRRDAGHQPIVSVVFNMDAAGEKLHFEGLTTQTTAIPRQYETYDIFFNVKQIGDTLALEWMFNTDLFDRHTAQLRLREFATMLDGIAQNAQQTIALLPILPPIEQQTILHDWTNTAIASPQNSCIHQLFEQQVARTPQRIAAACMDDSISYDDLNRQANRLAHYLIGKGVGRNVPVGILIGRSIEMLTATLAVLKAGGTYVPLEGQNNPIERLALIADDAAIQFLLTQKHSIITNPEMLISKETERPNALIYTDRIAAEIAAQPDTNPNVSLHTDSIAYIIYTSGSTAKPKGVIITHASAVDFLHCFGLYPGLRESDTVFAVASLSFDPSVQDLFLPLIKGGRVYIATHETIMNGQLFKQELQRSGATIIQATPATWNMLLSVDWQGDKQLRVMSGGEGLTRELAQKLAGKTAELWNIYGPTETTVWATARKITATDFEGIAEFALKIGYLPVGRPIPNSFVYILDQNLQPVPIGVPGEICIGGPGVMVGYLNRPDLNKSVLIENPFKHPQAPTLYKTGDIGRWLPNGDIEYLHRADNQVKIRGYRIELGEIESVIGQYEDMRQNVVVVRPDGMGNKRLVAYVITHDNRPLHLANLRLFLNGKLPEYMMPAVFVQMEEFPLTSTLKINRRALPEPDNAATPDTEKRYEAPHTEHEKILAAMWEELLHVAQVSINDNFFELGGHSLVAVTMMARITKQIGKTLPLAILLEYSTIKKLAGLLDGNEMAKWDCLVPVKASGSKVPIYIVHGAGLHVLLFNTLSSLMCSDQPVYALQAHGLNGLDRPYDRIEDIAAHYVSEVVQHNPAGPYALAGYSFGGTIAFEMAKQLTAAGRKVTLVGLFDTVAPVGDPETGLGKMMLLGKKVGAALTAIAKDPIPALQYRANTLQRTLHRLKWKMSGSDIVADPTETNQLVDAMNNKAYENYCLTPYSGTVHLFRAESRRYYVSDTEFLGWMPYAKGGVEIINVKGDHHTLFSPPHNAEFAKMLQACLDRVHRNF